LATQYGCRAYLDWRDAVRHPGVQIVIAATSNDSLAPVTIDAARQKKHVLCEKPLGRDVTEARRMVLAARENGVCLKVGFNHRFHPGVMKAHEVVKTGGIGQPLYIRTVYGHGGRSGYADDWRANGQISGGGEMLDQGIHVVDLSRWFLGDFSEVTALTATYFWKPAAPAGSATAAPKPVEDNAFVLMRTPGGQVASIHASWTQWKNRFSFEVYGDTGYVSVDGLHGSYGPEKLTWGKRPVEFGVPSIDVFDFDASDRSWNLEWADFVRAIRNNGRPSGSGCDGLAAMQLVAAVYESAALGRVVRVEDNNTSWISSAMGEKR
jgi:predicted dehydrogenase